jgi:hypothetical protein
MKNPVLVASIIGMLSGAAQPAHASAPDDADTRLAINYLSDKLSVEADSIEIVNVAVMDWPDSSIGCPAPGTQYLQMITRGSLVLLRAAQTVHRVHVGNKRAVMCERTLQGSLPNRPTALPGINVQDLMRAAQEDLADRLGVAPADVVVAGVQTAVWPNSALGCEAPEQVYGAAEVSGYRVKLDFDGRLFTYHTDQEQVIPCPAIETE